MDPWSPADPLGSALHALRLTGTFYCRSELSAPWGFSVPPLGGTWMLHAVTRGHARLWVGDGPPLVLGPGDMALVPHGAGHRLGSGQDVRTPDLFGLDREAVSERYEVLRYGGGGAPTGLVCAVVRVDHPAARLFTEHLPPAVVVEAWGPADPGWVQSTLRLMADEAQALRPGGETIVTRLADVLVVYAVRSWIDRDPSARVGWLGALQDPLLGPALASVHREPERDWTVATLADAASMSRSAFAARFTALVGEPPMRYLTRWRMELARAALEADDAPVAHVAERLGYQSETAFSRAFRRHTGSAPGAFRRDRHAGAVW